jgi:hypothetical protein
LTAPTRNVYVEGPCKHCFGDKSGEMVENQCTKSRCMGCRGKRRRGEVEVECGETEGDEAELIREKWKEILVRT